ncbi:hypothetical protein BO70DRAFT_397181 [Aspergillus heteromorphus CBS 117.55]|uniref:Uncharacterized protein n=1 Tax=Aspergillus heteromorphus CBS 117.55 TaxID=1448321 RepID=A0A317VZN4_9EURO|nr:uncharacterized protein BO70DRAFT_397181 [Aspergillus heteromorphus CBS 117.55]PWY79703.1 hypothetical protein BO70DRAFT_397181 [Aspergillus heteromorphus CBS 117.55]
MKFSILAVLALLNVAIATPVLNANAPRDTTPATLAAGATCNKDGSMGNCQSGFCLQDVNAATGVCQ